MAARPAARRRNPTQWRLALLALVLVGSWLGLGYRLFEVQVVRAEEFSEMGLGQRLTRKSLPPDRGTIFDRNGDPLAMTIEARSLYVVPDQVEDPVYVTQQVAARTDRDWKPMLEAIRSGREEGSDFTYLARQVEPPVAEEILGLGLAGLYSIPEPLRVYPAGPIPAHVVGMVDIDGQGIEGLEYTYDDALTGQPGELVYERDLQGVPIPQGYREVIPAVPGDDLVTTIDLPLQYSAYEACQETIERTSARGCWTVALHAETGEVLAMAGAPGFDPEERTALDGGPFENFAVRGMYEPGSTQKLITVATALETGALDLDTVIPQVGDTIEITDGACRSDTDDLYGCFQDFSPHETRDMTVREIFTISSNVGTIKLSQRLPDGSMLEYMERFGLGDTTGVDYSGEAGGLIGIDPGCSSCLASASIGYAVAVTPLQMASAYAAVANDGVWTEPSLARSRVGVDGEVTSPEPETRRVVSEDTAWVMRQLLARVVADGTGQAAEIAGYEVGGKTGTANKLGDDGEYTEETMASFIGMAPIDDPKVVVAVVVDDPAYEFRTGGLAAAPAFADVMEAALHGLGVTPDVVTR